MLTMSSEPVPYPSVPCSHDTLCAVAGAKTKVVLLKQWQSEFCRLLCMRFISGIFASESEFKAPLLVRI